MTALRLNPGIKHRGLKVYQVDSNGDTRLTFDLFTAMSTLRPYTFVRVKYSNQFRKMYLKLMAETYNVWLK